MQEDAPQKKQALPPLTWQAHEYVYVEKTPDWYWALGVLGVTASIAALLWNNVLFALLILAATFTLSLHAAKPPKVRDFAITQRGVRIDNELYPYTVFKGFSIDELSPDHQAKLILIPESVWNPRITIPIEDVDPDDVHDFLSIFLEDLDEYEPVFHRFMEWLGF
jgi:hypothetical protein